MAFNIVVPPLSESVVEATVSEWQKKVGDAVKSGEVVVILETDKVSVEVTAAGDGILAEIAHPEGADVKAGDVLGVVEGEGSAAAAAAPATSETPTTVETPHTAAPVTAAAAPVTAAAAPVTAAAAPVTAASSDPKASPVARRVAEANSVDLAQVPPRDGQRVMKADVVEHLSKQAAPAPAAPPPAPAPAPAAPALPRLIDNSPREERIKMTRRRRTIASRLVQAKTEAAMLTTFNEVDMSAVMDVRARRKESFQKKYGVGLGFSSFFVKATIGALKAFPLLNAEIDGDTIIQKNYYDIGMAIGAEEGLVVPVLRDADKMSFAEIEKKIKEYADQARSGTLALESLLGGTFSITNGGVFGSLLSTPILNYPQVGILGLHGIKERPVAVNGQVVIRPMMYLALTYDHRIVDGREAVQFLVKVKELIEDPETLLLEG
ncbi:2-oxoglutarate dehydrogenase complex dihydrolipoyllysine-residue succinyltransferase (plasmid) [Aggregatilineales bacterium SYSU G02658]